jgi:hypothetical protein
MRKDLDRGGEGRRGKEGVSVDSVGCVWREMERVAHPVIGLAVSYHLRNYG